MCFQVLAGDFSSWTASWKCPQVRCNFVLWWKSSILAPRFDGLLSKPGLEKLHFSIFSPELSALGQRAPVPNSACTVRFELGKQHGIYSYPGKLSLTENEKMSYVSSILHNWSSPVPSCIPICVLGVL